MIHIIDDDQYVREGFSLLLQSAGMESKSFENAEEFLKLFIPGEKDLLILDINMPGMNGCSLLEILKKKGVHLPVIVVTAYPNEGNWRCAKDYGVLAFLRKPVDGDALIDMIKFNYENKHD